MIRTQFPFAVEEIENSWLTLVDGTRLAVRLWLPEGSLATPVPAVLEYLPYRKDDGTAWQDSTRHPYFAGCGYAAVRVDMRGTGDSDGILMDEYLKQEQDDALEVIAWIAEQPWCSGSVGMIGYSWGGFNGLQIAARRPPALRAVVSAYSTDDRYTDDCHYQGGCVLGSDLLKWASAMRAINALPPDPRFREDWRELWLDRLDRTPAYIEPWLTHQRRDEFWKQGSVAEDYSSIEAATYVVGGWADPYTNAVPRLVEHLSCPRKGLIGPWKHILPYRGKPEPAIGFLQECVRWFDRYLKGVDNGIDREPAMTVWLQEPVAPATDYHERPGRWLALDGWPPVGGGCKTCLLGADGTIANEGVPVSVTPRSITGDQRTGETQGVWCANGMPDELAGDQRLDDERSLCFDSEPLPERMELLGTPEVVLDLAVNRSVALVSARLCDVAPDGSSTLITWGLLNLTHRVSHEEPTPLELRRREVVRLPLNAVGQAMPAGHRLRLAISPTYWPSAWPSPDPVTLWVFTQGESRLELPLYVHPEDALEPPAFGPAEMSQPLELAEEQSGRTRTITHDDVARTVLIRDEEHHEHTFVATGTRETQRYTDEWTVTEGDPLSAHVRCERDFTLSREGWGIRVHSVSEMRSEHDEFMVTDSLEAYEGGMLVFSREGRTAIPRDLV